MQLTRLKMDLVGFHVLCLTARGSRVYGSLQERIRVYLSMSLFSTSFCLPQVESISALCAENGFNWKLYFCKRKLGVPKSTCQNHWEPFPFLISQHSQLAFPLPHPTELLGDEKLRVFRGCGLSVHQPSGIGTTQ